MITFEQIGGNVVRLSIDTDRERRALHKLLERKIKDPDSGLKVPITVVWGKGLVPAGLVPYMVDKLQNKFKLHVKTYEEDDEYFPIDETCFVNRDPRDYQLRAARTLLSVSRGIMEGVTGAGKTTVIGAMIHAIMRERPDWRIGVIGFTTDHWGQVRNALHSMEIPTQQVGRGNPSKPVAIGRFSAFEKNIAKAGPWNEWLRTCEVIIYDECLRGDSLVETERGPIPIRDLKGLEGIRVLSHDTRSKSLRYERMTAWMPKGKRKTVKLRLSNGQEIYCTPDHKFLTSCGWKSAGELCPEDRLVGSFRKSLTGQPCDLPVHAGQSTERVEGTFIFGCEQNPPVSGLRPINSGYLNAWSTNPVYVVSAEDSGVEDVYDIEVENTHNFVANGVVVHNCRHLGSASTYINFARQINPLRTYGFDGTPLRNFEDDDHYKYWEDMQTIGYCGPIRVKIQYRDLQRLGYLPLTYVNFVTMPKLPKGLRDGVPRNIQITTNYNLIYKHLIVENDWRTSRFARLITNLSGGGKIIALIKQHEHARRLMEMLLQEDVESMAWFGAKKALAVSPSRGVYDAPFTTDEVRRRFMETDLPVVVGSSVLSEAISLDVATDAVNLAAGRTFSLSGQRTGRIMRRDGGRTPMVTFWDAWDMSHRILESQSRSRKGHLESLGLHVQQTRIPEVVLDLRRQGYKTARVIPCPVDESPSFTDTIRALDRLRE